MISGWYSSLLDHLGGLNKSVKIWSLLLPFCIPVIEETDFTSEYLFFSNSRYFKILDAYYTLNIPGQANLPTYRDYYIKILVKSNDLKFDSLWVNQTKLPVHIARTKGAISSQIMKFGKGDTILLKSSLSMEKSENVRIPLPFKTDAEAVLSFYLKNKKKYQSVKSMPLRKN